MADEPVGAPGGGTGGGTPAASPGVGGTSMTAEQVSAPGGDLAFLNAPDAPASVEPKGDEAAPVKPEEVAGAEKPPEAAVEDINLAALEEGQPEWLGKITDPAAKAEVEKLLEYQKAFSDKFKDAADLDAFFKELPGGREQVAALQTLSREIAEQDTALGSNTPEGNAMIAEKYLSMTPDKGMGLLRAAAQHMAKTSPESWNELSSELINSTLHAAGVGADLQTILGAIAEMRAASQGSTNGSLTEDQAGEAFGRAAAKLLGAPKAEQRTDPNLERARQETEAARAEGRKAQTESWQYRSEKSGDKVTNHLSTETGKLLAKVLPASISEKDRASLRNDITAEVMSQVTSDAWIASQVKQLIGWSSGQDGTKGPDYSNANLRASQADWDRATQLITEYATPKLIAKAVSKVVSKWSRERAAGNSEARDKARNAATTVDVGAAKTPAAMGGKKAFTPEQMRARNGDGSFVVSDSDFLNS